MIVVHMQTTLDNRIATADGTFWEPFSWGEQEQALVNDCYRTAGTWAMSRVLYDAIAPLVGEGRRRGNPTDVDSLGPADLEFAGLLEGMRKVVFTNDPDFRRAAVLRGDLAPQLAALRDGGDGDVILLRRPGHPRGAVAGRRRAAPRRPPGRHRRRPGPVHHTPVAGAPLDDHVPERRPTGAVRRAHSPQPGTRPLP